MKGCYRGFQTDLNLSELVLKPYPTPICVVVEPKTPKRVMALPEPALRKYILSCHLLPPAGRMGTWLLTQVGVDTDTKV